MFHLVALILTGAVLAQASLPYNPHVHDPELKKFFDKYDGSVRPYADQKKPVHVRCGTLIKHMVLDPEHESLFISAFGWANWHDPRLDEIMKKKSPSGKLVNIDPHAADDLWRPDVFLQNAYDVDLTYKGDRHVWLRANETDIFYGRGYNSHFHCAGMKAAVAAGKSFGCSVFIESYTHPSTEVVLDWGPNYPVVYDKNLYTGCFDLVDTIVYDECHKTYYGTKLDCLEVQFRFRAH